MQTLDVGEVASIATRWWNGSGVASEPSAIALTIIKPDGSSSVTTKAGMVGSESVPGSGVLDVWTALVACDVGGLWRYLADGTVAGEPVVQPEAVFLVGAADLGAGLPCESWASWADVERCTSTSLSGVTAETRDSILTQVTEILYNLSGRRYRGVCERTRTLCLSCAHCWPRWCECDPHDAIDLGGAEPVWGVWNVVIAGATLDPSAYTTLRRRFLVRTDGMRWPAATTITDPTSFRATWAAGWPVPEGGKRAAALFAAEVAKSCTGGTCEIPQRINTINREGVSYVVIDSMKMLDEGRTGVYMVDLWLTADEKGNRVRPGMFSPAVRARGARHA